MLEQLVRVRELTEGLKYPRAVLFCDGAAENTAPSNSDATLAFCHENNAMVCVTLPSLPLSA